MVTSTQSTGSPQPPPIGALIDDGAFELVEILGYGGYGIVYRAVDTYSSHPTSYAVKCLPHSNRRNATRQRQLHIREITLHQLASAHPGVVTLHRVIEDQQYTWIVMDYCPDGDLFTQILHNRRYLANNDLIKEVFLQLLDAVDYCHSLNIYHRDLKPENILCFDDGLRLAITDFGLATTDKMSTEFRTGSVYHMSPECQGGDYSPTKNYSPMFNDIWSLGIILLNLITGRNPWKSASADDCTFQAYLKDPSNFLPTVLPISQEVNELLVRTLEVDWRHRITLREMRQAIKEITNFYSPDVLFEDSMARCPWEAGIGADEEEEEVESDSSGGVETELDPEQDAQAFLDEVSHTQWSHDSDSEMVFTTESPSKYSWDGTYEDTRFTDIRTSSVSPSSSTFSGQRFHDLRSSSGPSTYSLVSSSPSIPSPPVTPGPEESLFPAVARRPDHLTLDIDGLQANYYPGSIAMLSADTASAMHTAIETSQLDEYGLYASFFESRKAMDTSESAITGMIITPTDYEFDDDDMDGLSTYEYTAVDAVESGAASDPMSIRPESPVLGLDLGFSSAEATYVDLTSQTTYADDIQLSQAAQVHTTNYSFLTFTSPDTSTFAPSLNLPQHESTSSEIASALGSPFEPVASPSANSSSRTSSSSSSRHSRSRSRKSRLLNPMRLAFTRRSRSPGRASSSSHPPQQTRPFQAEPAYPSFPTHWTLTTSTSPTQQQPFSCFATPAPSPKTGTGSSTTALAEKNVQGIRRRATRKRLRSPRDWFSPGKLFAAVMPSP